MKAAVVASMCLVLLAGCEAGGPQSLVGTLERDRIELAADQTEILAAIMVEEGQLVEAGQTIAGLDTSRMEARLDEARANRDAAAARLAELVRGPRREAIAEARASLDRAQAEAERAKHHYERIKRLRSEQLVSQSELDDALANRDARRAERGEAAARLESLLEGTTVEELDRARADVRAAEARMATLEHERSRLILRAPAAGWVDALPYEVGERVPAGATVAVLLASRAPFARIYVPETMRAEIVPGQPARVHIDGREEAVAGRVRFVSNSASFTPFYALTERDRGRLAYLTEVRIEDPSASELPAGVPVEVRFAASE